MPGPSPRIDYSPVQSVEPTTQAPNDTLSVRADPGDFGAQIGQAKEQLGESQIGLGKSIAGIGGDVTNVATDVQGIFNEHDANQADMALAVQGGKVDSAYKLNEGFAAAQNKDKAVQDYLSVNQSIRNSLNPAAARAYDQLANRRMSYTIQGMNDYAVQQTKSALKSGLSASIQMNEDMASQYGIASDPNQLGYQIGSVKHDLNNLLTNPAMGGPLAGLSATTNKDGTLQFDTSTPEGQSAQAFYDNNLKTELGKIYSNAAIGIATDNDHGSYVAAEKFISDNKANIPAATYTQLAQKFYPLAQTEKIHGNNENILANANSQFLNQGPSAPLPGQPGTAASTPNVPALTTAIFNQESGNGRTSNNVGQIENQALWNKYAKPGQNINNPDDNREVSSRAIADYSKEYNGDAGRVATAWFSGEGNVAPPGSPLPYKNGNITDGSGKTVASYVADINGRLAGNTGATGLARPVTQADYLQLHEPELVQQARDQAKSAGMDSTYQDQAAQAMHTRIAEQVSAQTAQARAYSDSIIAKVTDPKNPITNMYQLMYGDQQTRQVWAQAITLNPFLERTVQDVVTAQAAGQSKTYGTTPYAITQDILQGKVTDQSQLGQYGIGGDKAPLSGSGFMQMSKVIQQSQTPQGQAFSQSESKFLSQVHDELTGANMLPPGAINGAGEKRTNDYMNELLPQIDATYARLQNAGKNPSEMFDPKSPDYVGRGLKTPPLATLMNESLAATTSTVSSAKAPPAAVNANIKDDPATFNNRDDLAKAVKSGKVDRQAAIDYSHKRGWTVPTPQVPKPSF